MGNELSTGTKNINGYFGDWLVGWLVAEWAGGVYGILTDALATISGIHRTMIVGFGQLVFGAGGINGVQCGASDIL
ncbi:hypothetical protein HOY80DRAFT_993709 [Tuber brumale]|nr:hypothetical protein HOY80DRAFT_993709 [Tuber brumale]